MDELRDLVRSPREFMGERLMEPPLPQTLLWTRVTPWAAVRPAAVFVQSLIAGTAAAGWVLALGSYALQLGTWFGLSLVLPALARQFHADLSERQAFTLVTYASLPLWLAGVLYAIPQEPAILLLWTRSLLLVVALFCLFLIRQGIAALGVRRSMRLPLLGGITVAAVLIYGFLSVLIGIGAHVVLYFIR